MKSKYKIYILAICLMFIFIVADNRIIDVKADDYTTYLYNNEMTITKDYGSVFEHTANYENEYRNLFYSNVQFDYSTSYIPYLQLDGQGTKANYLTTQVFFDNMSNDNTFKEDYQLVSSQSSGYSEENLINGTYEVHEGIEQSGGYDENVINSDIGTRADFNDFDYEMTQGVYYMGNTLDSFQTQNVGDSNAEIRWFDSVSYQYGGTFYQNLTVNGDDEEFGYFQKYPAGANPYFFQYVDDYNPASDSDYVYDTSGSGTTIGFQLGTFSIPSGHTINKIEIYMRAKQTGYCSIPACASIIWTGGSDIDDFSGFSSAWSTQFIIFDGLTITQAQLDTMRIIIGEPLPCTAFYISSIYLKCFYTLGECNGTIINQLNGHTKVYAGLDNDTYGTVGGTHYFQSARTNINIEFWFCKSKVIGSTNVFFTLHESGNVRVQLIFSSNEVRWVKNATTSYFLYTGLVVNVFTHFRLNLNDATDQYAVYMNGTLLKSDCTYYTPSTTGITSVYFGSATSHYNYTYYVDAIGCYQDDNTYWTSMNVNPYDLKPLCNDYSGFAGTLFYLNWFAFNTYVKTANITNQKNCLQITDNNANGYQAIRFLNKGFPDGNMESGNIEFYFRMTDTSKIYKINGQNNAYQDVMSFRTSGGYLQYYYSSWTNICPISSNQWYHIEISFECGDGGYKELDNDTYYVYINGVRYGAYNFKQMSTYIWFLQCYSEASHTGYSVYFNSLDFSRRLGYTEHRNVKYYEIIDYQFLSYPTRIDVDFYSLEVYVADYNNNSASTIERYMYNFTLNDWALVASSYTWYFSSSNYTDFFSSENKVLYRYVINHTCFMNDFSQLTIDVFQYGHYYYSDDDAYHYITNTVYVYEGTTLRGRIITSIEIHKYFVDYEVLSSSYVGGNWLSASTVVEYKSGDLIIDLEQLEFLIQTRLGLSSSGSGTSIYTQLEITINYNITLFLGVINEIVLVGTYWENVNNLEQYAFSYHKDKYYTIDGVKKGFSCIRGVRFLRDDNVNTFNRFFEIPYFNEDITLSVPISYGNQASEEPIYPSMEFWTYQTFRVAFWKLQAIEFENWSVDYSYIQSQPYTAKFFYDSERVSNNDLGGDWYLKFGDVKLKFNFLRDGVKTVINACFVFVQFLLFLTVASLSFIFMWIGCGMIVLLWNNVLYYLFLAFIMVIWWAFAGLVAILSVIWMGLVWVYENLLIPFMDWYFNVFFPLAIEVFIQVWAFLITCLIYCMTLGQIDFWETYDSVYTMLRAIADFIWENTIIIMENLPALFIAISLYLVLIGMTYVKYIYCKVRGYKERAEALYDSLMTYLLPITLTYAIIKKIYNSIPTAGGG